MPPKKYYDANKYTIADHAPVKWAQVTQQGFREYVKAYLTDEDCEALIAANSDYVTRVDEVVEVLEDPPEDNEAEHQN